MLEAAVFGFCLGYTGAGLTWSAIQWFERRMNA